MRHATGARPDGRAPAHPTRALEIHDPATEALVGRVAIADAATVAAVVAAARAAAPAWAATPATERAAALRRWARRVREAADELAELVTREMGKPLAEARAGVAAGAAAIDQYAALGPLHQGRTLCGDPDATDAMVRTPRGVVAVVLPWNDPVALVCQHVAACLAVGNAVVVKPSERAPLAVERALELLAPLVGPDVVRWVHGDGSTGAALVAADGIDAVLHTGSVATGRAIARACGERLRKAVLELGGNDALIVDGDVDPTWAAEQAARGAFANAGQICTSVERIFVHAAIAAPFLEALVARARTLRVGPGMDATTEMGPLVDRRLRDAVHAHVVDAVGAGARALTGGEVPDGPGAFYPPTVLAQVTPAMAVMRQETFGPVAPVMAVRDFDAALTAARDGDHGLAATVLTGDARLARRACAALDVGTVKVNAVWGGAPGGSAEPRRASGLGLGYGPGLLDELTAWRVTHHAPLP